MADTVSTTVISNLPNQRRRTYSFTNVSDGTGESAVQKIDISGLPTTKYDTAAPTKVKIMKIQYSISSGWSVAILFDHDTDDEGPVLTNSGAIDFSDIGGFVDPASTGGTGDILFTTVGAGANDTYNIIMEIEW